MHAQEDVLQHVVGVVPGCVEQPRRLAAQRGAVALIHDRERLLVARGEAGEERAVLRELVWEMRMSEVGGRIRNADGVLPSMCRIFSICYRGTL